MDYWKVQDLESVVSNGSGGSVGSRRSVRSGSPAESVRSGTRSSLYGSPRSVSNSNSIESIMRNYSTKYSTPHSQQRNKLRAEEEKSKTRAESVSGSSTTLTESHVGTFVEHVTGETLRYTARDMEVIRREARIQAESSKGDLATYKILCANMNDMLQHILGQHQEELAKRDNELSAVVADRDSLQDDMKEMEKSHEHLKSRFYRLRNVVEDMRENEKKLKKSFVGYEDRLMKEQERYREYKQKATDTINKANVELDTIEARKEQELTRVRAENRLLKTKHDSLESRLNQKEAENKELLTICDQLMGSK